MGAGLRSRRVRNWPIVAIMRSQDFPAAVVLAAVLFGTSGLGLALWMFVVVPLCALAWAGWTLATLPKVPYRRHFHINLRLPHL